MSSKKGDSGRTRAQKHQNSFAFKNDLHDKHTPKIKLLNSINVCEVCEQCKLVIEWKIKYKKYKPLPKPKTCNKCGNRNVKRAYHVLCKDCALANKQCAKCLKSSTEVRVLPPELSTSEKQKLDVEMDRLIKSLPERKRRTFRRYMKNGKKDENVNSRDKKVNENDEEADPEIIKIPHTRDELIKKIEQLKLAAASENDDDDEDNSEDFDDDSDIDFSDFDE